MEAKTFYQTNNIGKVKYTISWYNGEKKHADGSPFFDVRIFKNMTRLNEFRQELFRHGYKSTN